MKSSTLIVAIILVAQAVLIMGVFAAVSIENSAALGEKVNEEPELKVNPGNLNCCNNCTPVGSNGLHECQDTYENNACPSGCMTCAQVKNYRNKIKCVDEFNGPTCGPPCKKKN